MACPASPQKNPLQRQRRWARCLVLAILLILLWAALGLLSVDRPTGSAALPLPYLLGGPTQPSEEIRLSPSPTPIPWDDILVSYREGKNPFVPYLAVAGPNVYVASLYNDGVFFTRSTDGGYTFPPSVWLYSGSFNGSLSLTLREGAGAEERNLYLAFAEDHGVFLLHSGDRGVTWSGPLVIHEYLTAYWPRSPKAFADASGAIHVAWYLVMPSGVGYFYLASSTDRGETWSDPVQISPQAYDVISRPHAASLVSRGDNLYFGWTGRHVQPGDYLFEVMVARSTDGGESWFPPVRVDDGGTGLKETMSMAVDTAGVIYVAWSEYRLSDDYSQSYVSRSTDGGQSWSPSVRMDDNPCLNHSELRAIAVDGETVSVHAILVDMRNYCDQSCASCDDVFYTHSTDGGATWKPNQQISNPVPYTEIREVSLRVQEGLVYTAWTSIAEGQSRVWLDIHDPGLPPVTMTPTPEPTGTPTATPSPSPTFTPSPSTTPTAPPSPSPTSTPSPTATPSPSPTTEPGEWRLYLPHVGRQEGAFSR